MSTIVFGTGFLTIGTKQVGIVESASADIKGTIKSLAGGSEYAIANAVTGRSLSGKVSFRSLDAPLISSLLSGATTTAGSTKAVVNESATVSGSVHTATVTKSANWSADGGVIGANGLGFTKVDAAPALGQYSVSAGVYTFNASEAQTVRISYFWTDSTGTNVEIANGLVGVPTTYNLKMFTQDAAGGSFGLEVYAAVISSLSLAFASEDYAKQDLEWTAQQNASGKIYKLHY